MRIFCAFSCFLKTILTHLFCLFYGTFLGDVRAKSDHFLPFCAWRAEIAFCRGLSRSGRWRFSETRWLRTARAAEIGGIRALVVHTGDGQARRILERIDFEGSPTDPLHLFVAVKNIWYFRLPGITAAESWSWSSFASVAPGYGSWWSLSFASPSFPASYCCDFPSFWS